MAVQKRNSGLVDLLRVDFQGRYEANFSASNAVSLLRMIPGLRGAWVAGCFDENYDITDLSEQGRTVYATNSPEFGFTGLAPYVHFDGSTNYLHRSDEAGLDITGGETGIEAARRGLSIGGWFKLDNITQYHMLMGKWDQDANLSYILWYHWGQQKFYFSISVDGTNAVGSWSSIASVSFASTSQWAFVVGKFDPGTEQSIFVNGQKTTELAGIVASCWNSTAPFRIGADSSGVGGAYNYLDGYFSLGFLSTMFLSDTIIQNLFAQTRAMFGV